jgi:hypothetical protein
MIAAEVDGFDGRHRCALNGPKTYELKPTTVQRRHPGLN